MNVLVTGGAGYIGSHAALESLPIDLINRIYTLAVTMNAEENRAAFHAGVKLGVQLVMEVQREDSRRDFE